VVFVDTSVIERKWKEMKVPQQQGEKKKKIDSDHLSG